MARKRNRNIYYKGIKKDIQINKIIEEVGKIFEKESKNGLSIDINSLIKKIKNILESFEMLERVSKRDDIITKDTKLFFKNLKVNTVKKRQLLIEGYVIIMDFLEMLTNTSIDYRIYSINEKTNKVYFKTFSKEEVLQSLLPGLEDKIESKFRLNTKEVDEKIQNNEEISNKEEIFISHFEKLYNTITKDDMNLLPNGFFVVKRKIINYYGNFKNKTPKNLFTLEGKYKNFTRGHIVEGLDISLFEASNRPNNIEKLIMNFNVDRVRRLFYTKNLDYDRIIGFKQGDNTFTNTQIKLINADLMDYSTILTYLSNIYISLTRKNTNIENLSDNIKYMFYEEINKNVEDNIKFFIDKKLNLEELDSKIFKT